MSKKALLLDLDGTVRETPGQVCPNDLGEQLLLPGSIEKMREYKAGGYQIIGVTNQGGIAIGKMTELKCREVLKELQEMTGNLFDKIYYAPHNKNINHSWTKPNPGMILEAQKDFDLDLKLSIMVGDRETDKKASENAGVGQYYYANHFFNRSKEKT